MAARVVFRPLILRYITPSPSHLIRSPLLQKTHRLQTLLPPLPLSPPARFLNTHVLADLRDSAVDFFRYLHGHKVSVIGSRGDETLQAVKTYLLDTLTTSVNHIRKTMSKDGPGTGKPKHADDDSLDDTVIAVIEPVFMPLYERTRRANFLPDVEGGKPGQPSQLCRRWFMEFATQELCNLPDEIPSKRPMAQDLSDDSVAETSPLDGYLLFNKEFRLQEIIGQLMQTAPNSDQEKRLLHESAEQLVAAMLRFLEMQSGLTRNEMDRSSSEESVEMRMKTGNFEGWQDAWGAEYRGDALKNLEKKILSISRTTVRNHSGKKKLYSMSRLIPIVQASGAGKSRLADMYASKHFAVSLVLQNGNSIPPRDPYASEYFRDMFAPKFASFLDEERLGGLETYRSMKRERYTPRSEPTYTKAHRSHNPTLESVPYPWAAVARLRVAYFLAALFNVLNEMLACPEYQTLSAWHHLFCQPATVGSLLRSGVKAERTQFWGKVIERANTLMYARENLPAKWFDVGPTAEVAEPNNQVIAETLERIIADPLVEFLSVHARKLQQDPPQEYPFVLIIDEAAYLHSSNYMRAFMWVLDQVVVKIIDDTKVKHELGQSDDIFFLMLGTHSQISHFAPDEHYPSERVFAGDQSLPSVFLNFAWDSSYKLPTERSLSASNTLHHLVQFGRPLWLSYVQGLERKNERMDMSPDTRLIRRACIQYAMMKIAPLEGAREPEREAKNSAFAIIALRIRLVIDLAHPKRASELVASKMRWLMNVSDMRQRIRTAYPSEPILVEAAACLMNGYFWHKGWINQFPQYLDESPVTFVLECLQEELNKSHVDRGANGELTARLLCVLAKDRAIRLKVGDHDYEYTRKYYDCKVHRGIHNDALLFHQMVSVKDFLKSLFTKSVYNEIVQSFKTQQKWAALDRAYINFSHWSIVKAEHDDPAYSKMGLFTMWNRHLALFCKDYFRNIDLLIPIAYKPDFDMSYMLISVKNKSYGKKETRSSYISRQNVDGIPRVEPRKKGNHYLGLKRLRFVYGKEQEWIKHSETKPFLAVVLSMGETDRMDKFVVVEKHKKSNNHRIVFAVRGFLNTYRFPSVRSKTALSEIVMRHDVSGELPESKPTNETERELYEQAQKVDGDFDSLITLTANLLGESIPSSTPKKK